MVRLALAFNGTTTHHSPPHHSPPHPTPIPSRAFTPRICDGTRVPTRQPGGPCEPQETRAGLLESIAGSLGPHGPGGCLSAPACGDFGPGPRFGIRHSPAVPHGRDRRGMPYSPVETVATHGIAAARATAGGRQGLLDLHPQRASIQAPTAATSGVGSKRPVGGRRHQHHDTAQDGGDKSYCG